MKILQSSVFRAICAIAVGIMLVKYPGNTVTWITIAIGVLFLLSGIISVVVYVHTLKQVAKQEVMPDGAYLTDAEGNRMTIIKPTFPIVGIGSLILGLLLALTPNVFATALMYIIGGILILGAINQFMNLLKPLAPVQMAMVVLGWCTLLYGVTELINALKIHREKRKFAKAQEIPVAEEIKEEITETPKDSDVAELPSVPSSES